MAKSAQPDAHPVRQYPGKPSIVVLPFTNMSSDPEQEYFSDGVSEDIITDLSKIAGLFVIARNSAFAYKNQGRTTFPDVCRALGVRFALEGSIRKAGNRVRITAQLIDGSSGGSHLGGALRPGTGGHIRSPGRGNPGDRAGAGAADHRFRAIPSKTEQPTENLEAYDCFLRGRNQWWRFTPAIQSGFAREMFERAISAGPEFFHRDRMAGSESSGGIHQ